MSDKKGFLDRIPSFPLLLVMAILLTVGAALTPRLEMSDKPASREGVRLDVSFSWPGVSPKVVEQQVTSRLEGALMAVREVESVSSSSSLGSGRVRMQLKKGANVPMVRFEVSAILRQLSDKLPEGVSYPNLSGGELETETMKPETQTLLTYRIHADMDGQRIREYMEQQVLPFLQAIPDVRQIQVTGGTSQYIEIVCDPLLLANYGLKMSDVADGLKTFIGKSNLVGDLDRPTEEGSLERITLMLSTAAFNKDIGEIPIREVDGKIIYLNHLATWTYRDRQPSRYFRVNGLNTVNMTVSVDAGSNLIAASERIRAEVQRLKPQLREGVYLTLISDASEEMQTELQKLLWRTLLSLLILLGFVWLTSRHWKYLLLIFLTLLTNLMTAVICYHLFDIRLHIYSLAGITVSFGMIIDASIVMVDHYGYYHDRKAFMSILAALLTTIGSLVIVFFMPDTVQHDLYDFSRIIIVNLSVALLVALLFVPALSDRLHYDARHSLREVRNSRLVLGWSRWYGRYLLFSQRHKGLYLLCLVLIFGLPLQLLPEKWDGTWREPVEKVFGGTMRLFTKALDKNRFAEPEREMKLFIQGKMPLGGSVSQLNEKVEQIEKFLAGFPEIKRFETTVTNKASIVVEFKEEYRSGSFPYTLESKVIGQLLNIGGADWSTSGVSPRGFSNSIDLTQRNDCMVLSGYNYDELYAYAQRLKERMSQNRRVQDLIVENSRSINVNDELFVRFDKEKIAADGLDVRAAYNSLRELLTETEIGRLDQGMTHSDIVLVSSQRDAFDLWHLQNAHLTVRDGIGTLSSGDAGRMISAVEPRQILFPELGTIAQRKIGKAINRENQQYTVYVCFNYIGSYESRLRFVNQMVDECGQWLPVGYSCSDYNHLWSPHEERTQYWLLLLIVVIVFFICSILFESFVQPFAIILLVPVAFIGTFLTFFLSGIPFGTGGFASMVLLCGLVVNSGIYIICEYNSLRGREDGISSLLSEKGRRQRGIRLYGKAYNHKIIPVFLTVLSTVLGLIPFFLDGGKADFWFSFAVGTTGGLLFSLIALVFVLPVFLPLHKRK